MASRARPLTWGERGPIHQRAGALDQQGIPLTRQGEDDLFGDIGELAQSVIDLARRAVAEYAPIVGDIVRSRSTDVRHIECALDGLLDFCFDADALLLYKKLCRHDYDIDPAATAFYIRSYGELWDSEPEEQPD